MDDLQIKNEISIPSHELKITTSKSGGPGGQHVNKSDTKVTVRWNIEKSSALTQKQKDLAIQNLQSQLTNEGDLIVSNSSSRSQQQNKQNALNQLANTIKKALHVPKKRMKTKVSKAKKEARLKEKAQRSMIKKIRSKKISYD